MSVALSTAGIKFGYGVEQTADTKPASFIQIPNAMSLPSLNPAPEAIDVTPLDATQFKTYIKGLQDVGGSLPISFSLNNEFKTLWGNFVTAFETAKAANKQTWVEFYIPDMTDAFCFQAQPSELGFGGAEPNSHLQIEAYVTPTGKIGWFTAVEPTAASNG